MRNTSKYPPDSPPAGAHLLPSVNRSASQSGRQAGKQAVTEMDVLLAWGRLLRREQTDVIVGYNILGFDIVRTCELKTGGQEAVYRVAGPS